LITGKKEEGKKKVTTSFFSFLSRGEKGEGTQHLISISTIRLLQRHLEQQEGGEKTALSSPLFLRGKRKKRIERDRTNGQRRTSFPPLLNTMIKKRRRKGRELQGKGKKKKGRTKISHSYHHLHHLLHKGGRRTLL